MIDLFKAERFCIHVSSHCCIIQQFSFPQVGGWQPCRAGASLQTYKQACLSAKLLTSILSWIVKKLSLTPLSFVDTMQSTSSSRPSSASEHIIRCFLWSCIRTLFFTFLVYPCKVSFSSWLLSLSRSAMLLQHEVVLLKRVWLLLALAYMDYRWESLGDQLASKQIILTYRQFIFHSHMLWIWYSGENLFHKKTLYSLDLCVTKGGIYNHCGLLSCLTITDKP